MLLRAEQDADTSEAWKKCSLHVNGMKNDRFPLQSLPPTFALVATHWGSGKYRAQWLDGDGKSLGTGAIFTIDDAAFPSRPLYVGPAAPAPAPASAAVATVDPSDSAAARAAKALAGEAGAIPLPMVLMLLGLSDDSRRREQAEAEARETRSRRDHEERIERIRADSNASIELERERSKARLEEIAAMQRTLAGAAPDAALREELRAMREEMNEREDEREDEREEIATREMSAWEIIGQKVLTDVVPQIVPHIPKFVDFVTKRGGDGG